VNPETKRALIAAGRRVAFTGLIILGAWLVLMILRVAIPAWVINVLVYESPELSRNTADWDWSQSLWRGELVSEMIGERIGDTLQLLAVGAGFALVTAALFLVIGFAISQIPDQPAWLVKTRQVLRMILVSHRVSTPVFYGGTLLFIFPLIWWDWSPSLEYDGIAWWPAFFVSLLPTWLLVQVGHGEISNWRGGTAGLNWLLARDIGAKLLITILRLAGALIVVSVLVERIFNYSGLGDRLLYALATRDYPMAFGVVWAFVLIVALAKLAADLIEIAYNHFYKRPNPPELAGEQTVPQRSIPRAWLYVSLALVVVFILIAIIGPFIAPYGYDEIRVGERLAPPGGEFILGTDVAGRDVFSRLLYGVRLDVEASAMITGIVMVVAIGWAFLAAFVRKMNNWVGDTLEDLVMLPRDILCAFPWLVLMLLLMSNVGPGLMQVSLVSSLVLLPRVVGMMREACSSPPEGHGWLYGVLWSIPIMLLFAVAGGILYVSSVSFLGYGIPEPWPELGSMINRGRPYMFQELHLAVWPGIFLVLLTLVWTMAGETLLERLGFHSKAVWSKVVE
jgi:peptide/nickel transport system permease protein